jgi:hypothetical protein
MATPPGAPLVPLREYARIIIAADAPGTAVLAHSYANVNRKGLSGVMEHCHD